MERTLLVFLFSCLGVWSSASFSMESSGVEIEKGKSTVSVVPVSNNRMDWNSLLESQEEALKYLRERVYQIINTPVE